MFHSLASSNTISFLLVFIEGLLSFFSPCVIPLIPVYMGYLAGNPDAKADQEENYIYNRKKVLLHTLCFVLGVSFAFFILGMSFTALGRFFQSKQLLFTRLAGIIIITLGLFQLGLFDFKFLNSEKKIHLKLSKKGVNPLIAILMGFTFSFAWTPCVGPALSSVLILASTASNSLIGNTLVLIYAIGFTIPFLLLGLFTTQVLNFLHNHKKLIKYTVKAGGVILIIMGVMTFTGWMNGVSGYLNSLTSTNTPKYSESEQVPEENLPEDNSMNTAKENSNSKEEDPTNEPIPAFDFTLVDQYGNEHTLSDYKGKVVFLNFWATWCPPCRKEMPDIEELYQEYNYNQDEVVFLGVANPRTDQNTNTREVDKEGVMAFLDENGYTFPVVFDETGEIYGKYSISALPTTFLIDKNGNFYGYAPGMLTKDIMKSIIEETLNFTD